jgi:hypothetical protein
MKHSSLTRSGPCISRKLGSPRLHLTNSKESFSIRFRHSIDRLLQEIEQVDLEFEAQHKEILARLPAIRRSPDNLAVKSYTRRKDSNPRTDVASLYKKMQRNLRQVAAEVYRMGR